MKKIPLQALCKTLLLIILLTVQTVFHVQAQGESFSGRVVKVLDGDTLEVQADKGVLRVRLAQIDAPERGQPFSQVARKFVLDRAAHRTVRVEVEAIDQYKRTVGVIFLPDGTNLNKELVAAGLAWQYRRYSQDPEYGTLEERAKTGRVGLWADKSPTPPWVWRGARRQLEKTGRGIDPDPVGAKTATEDTPCGSKEDCQQMENCGEAMFFFEKCKLKKLDRDGDGLPCELLCK